MPKSEITKSKNDFERKYFCPLCRTELINGIAIGHYCPNKDCKVLDDSDNYKDSNSSRDASKDENKIRGCQGGVWAPPTNFGELFILLLKKYNFGNQNKYSAIMEVKKATVVFLQDTKTYLEAERDKIQGKINISVKGSMEWGALVDIRADLSSKIALVREFGEGFL